MQSSHLGSIHLPNGARESGVPCEFTSQHAQPWWHGAGEGLPGSHHPCIALCGYSPWKGSCGCSCEGGHGSVLFLFALFPGVISGLEGGCSVMSVCKQGGACRQGSGGWRWRHVWLPGGGNGGKKSVQIKKHKGNGSRAWRRWRGRRGKRLLSPCKSFGKTVHHPPLIPLIKTTLVCRCRGQAAVFKEALAPPGPCLPGSGGSIWR